MSFTDKPLELPPSGQNISFFLWVCFLSDSSESISASSYAAQTLYYFEGKKAMKTVALVTGGTGFIGYHLCKFLYENGYKVLATGFNGENTPVCHNLFRLPLDQLPHNEMGQVDICFHQAANNNTLEGNLDIMRQANVIQSSNLFQKLLQENNCKNFVYASSCSIYGDQGAPFYETKTKPKPLNAYAKSKLEFEQFAQQFANQNNVKTIGLRYTNVYGKNEHHKGNRASMIYQILQKNLYRKEIELFTNGQQLRDWVYISDVIKANILASKYKSSGIFNVGYGRSCSFNYLCETISNATLIPSRIKYINCNFLDKYQCHTAVDLTKSNIELDYFPEVSVLEGVKMMI